MPFYENVFLVRPDVSAQQVEALADSFSSAIAEQGGKVTKVEHWGLRNLTYRIKKNRKAHYVLFNIDASATAIQGLEKSMRMSEDVLRSLTIRVDELEEGPSVMMQIKGRDDRGRRDRHDRNDSAADTGADRAAASRKAEPASADAETKNSDTKEAGE
ncbi:MAG: 30S ribosomal protein S6 [Proteobacteria bacterium]|nr:30S ribosomal protein S6 [Pseudomonadota bacterium]